MELKILYFGMIADATGCKEEVISLQPGCNTNQLEKILKTKYQTLQNLSFKIVVDQEIASSQSILKATNEIALLPPFSGG